MVPNGTSPFMQLMKKKGKKSKQQLEIEEEEWEMEEEEWEMEDQLARIVWERSVWESRDGQIQGQSVEEKERERERV